MTIIKGGWSREAAWLKPAWAAARAITGIQSNDGALGLLGITEDGEAAVFQIIGNPTPIYVPIHVIH
jgi:hypothetical protein